MSPASFDYIRVWLRERSGIALDETKRYLVETRLTSVLVAERLTSIDELIGRMRAAPNGKLEQTLVNALATTETSFFRDIAVFDGLRDTLLPDLIARRRAQKRLDIWCAACASGQEPYSLAISLCEYFGQLAGWTIRFLASDLSTEMLERARQGRFTQLEVNRGLPAKLLVKHFRQEGDDWFISDRLRQMVEFRQINLTSVWPVLGGMDLILLRNLMVYFDQPTKQTILRRVRDVLRPDGYLMLGTTETTLYIDEAYERVQLNNSSCYRPRPAATPAGGSFPKPS